MSKRPKHANLSEEQLFISWKPEVEQYSGALCNRTGGGIQNTSLAPARSEDLPRLPSLEPIEADSQDGNHSSSSDQTEHTNLSAEGIFGELPMLDHVQFSDGLDICIPSTISQPPTIWDSTFLGSPELSPTPHEDWALPQQMVTSSTNSPMTEPPILEDLPSRALRKAVKPRLSKAPTNLLGAARHQPLPETSEACGESSRPNINDTVQEHPLYVNMIDQADSFYHCPWEKKDHCRHKPTQHRSDYIKYLDFHLEAYRCLEIGCEKFSSASRAGLIRHEREVHNYKAGKKRFLCTYEGCNRAAAGNGFSRRYNLLAHQNRMHKDMEPTKSEASAPPHPIRPLRARSARRIPPTHRLTRRP